MVMYYNEIRNNQACTEVIKENKDIPIMHFCFEFPRALAYSSRL